MTATVVEATTTELVNKHSTSWPKWPYDWAVLWVLICTVHLTVCCCHVTYAFQSESKLYICLNIKELFPRNRHKIWSLNDSKGTWIHKQLVCKETLNLLAKLTEWSSWIVSTYLYGAFICSCHVTDTFQSESTLYICLNVEELSQNRRDIWSLSYCKGTRAHNRLVSKQTLNQLTKRTIWLSWIVSTYLYGAFDCMFFSCDVLVSEWIHTL